jgi:hypothetical protein
MAKFQCYRRRFQETCLTVLQRGMLSNATFNNISAISRRSVLLVEETGVPGENLRLAAIH